jgi:AI-2 transport system permease protein
VKILKTVAQAREFTSFLFVVALFLIVGAINPDFLSLQNILLSLNGSVVFTMLAVGIAFVIITGEIDVSIGATLGLAATVSAVLIRDGSSWIAAVLAALAVGAAIGLANGIGVMILRIPSIIMTLGINGVVRGLCYVYTGGKWVENLPFDYKALSQATLTGEPGSVTWFYLFAAAIAIGIYLLQTRSRRGRYFAAVGDNEGGANLIGIPVVRTKMTAFLLCSLFAAAAGLMYVSRIGFVTPTAGNGYEMKAIAACVLGGVSLSGGIGSMIGAALGAVIMASIGRILVFMHFSSNYDNTITGILLITIVVGDALLQKRASERARRKRLSARIAAKPGGGA